MASRLWLMLFRERVLGHLEPQGWHAVVINVQSILAESLPIWVCSEYCFQALGFQFWMLEGILNLIGKGLNGNAWVSIYAASDMQAP